MTLRASTLLRALLLCLFAISWPSSARAICGDGIVDPGEVCDDGNTASGDGCSSDCQNAPRGCCQVTGLGGFDVDNYVNCAPLAATYGLSAIFHEGWATTCPTIVGFPGDERTITTCSDPDVDNDGDGVTENQGDCCDESSGGAFWCWGYCPNPYDPCPDVYSSPPPPSRIYPASAFVAPNPVPSNFIAYYGCPTYSTTCGVSSGECGNGLWQIGEECDDGNTDSDDGCSATCTAEPCFPCSGEPPTCRVPDSCKRPTLFGASSVQIKYSPASATHKLVWQWQKGEATSSVEYGDPVSRDSYDVCVFHASGDRVKLASHLRLNSGGNCDGKPCWKSRDAGSSVRGYKYKDAGADGISSASLKTGDAGKASIVVKAKGASLDLPIPPINLPLLVQLQSSTGTCWQAEYLSNGAIENSTIAFKGKSK